MTQKTKKIIFILTEITSLAMFSVLLWFTMTHSLRGLLFFVAGSMLIHVLFDTIRRTFWKEDFIFNEQGEEISQKSIQLIKIGKYAVQLNPKNVKMHTMLLDAAMGFLFAVGTFNLLDALETYNISLDVIGVPLAFLIGAIALLLMKFNTSRQSAEKAKALAERANESKSHFLATMSHEIRTPLNAIIGITQIQLQKDNLPQEYATVFDRIYTSGDGLLSIINDILDMSKIEAGKFELLQREYFLASLVHDVVALNVVRIGTKPIDFLLDINAELPAKLLGDDIRIKQILNNLLSNAIKYTDKGTIKLIVDHTEKDGLIILRFRVIDSGQGMKPEDIENIFSAYSRFNLEVNRITEGIGLGMNITQRLVEMMRGNIEVASEYGKGSTFTVSITQREMYPYEIIGAELASIVEQSSRLGLYPHEIIGDELASQLSNFSFNNHKAQLELTPMPYGKVLIVDDTEINLYVAEGLLAPYKLLVETVDSGFAAIDKVDEQLENAEKSQAYDIIFMDHMMPKMDGIETTRKIRERGYKGTIVALTANAIAGNADMFQQNGFDGFISKPIDVTVLDETLHKFIRDKRPEDAKIAEDKIYNEKAANNFNANNIEYKENLAKTPQNIETAMEVDSKMADIFCRDAEKAIKTMHATLSDLSAENIKLFTITVHSMRSALLNIGESADKIRAAQLLEEAGNAADSDYIESQTENFMQILQNVVTKLRPAAAKLQAKADIIETPEDAEYLAKYLKQIQQACEDYDDAWVYAALKTLSNRKWSFATADEIEHIHNALFLHSDFERAAELAAKMLGKIEKS